MKQIPEKLKNSAPEGTVWFGGPVDRSMAALRIFGDNLNPDEVSELLRCKPSESWKKGGIINGTTLARTGRWSLDSNLPNEADIEEKVWDILKRVSANKEVWHSITTRFRVDLFCGIFLESNNRGFGLSVRLMRKLSHLGIEIGFDVYGA